MTGFLLDTNILSDLRRPMPERRVVTFMATTPRHELSVSTVTLAELRFGIHQQPSMVRKAELNLWLEQSVRPMFGTRILELTEDIMLRWRLLVEDGRKAGRTFSQPDLLIAATALEHDLNLVTRNVRDFSGLNLKIYNPWDDGL